MKEDITKDQWLTEILRKNVYKLSVDSEYLQKIIDQKAEEYNSLQNVLNEKNVFVYTKVSAQDTKTVNILEKLGFKLVDTNVAFSKPISNESKNETDLKVRFAIDNDNEMVTSLALESFIYTRFHLDPNISNEDANKIKSLWAQNYFLKKRGDQMVVALEDDKVVGFAQLLHGKDKTLIIDLIGVDEDHRRQGIAQSMINFAQVNCEGFAFIKVGTQVANIPSMRLYEKMGFRIESSQYILHYHGANK